MKAFCVRSDAQRAAFLTAPLHSLRGGVTGQSVLFFHLSSCLSVLSFSWTLITSMYNISNEIS